MSLIGRIIKSRFKRSSNDIEVAKRREDCRKCPFNTLNMDKIPLKKQILKKLSLFFSWFTGNSDKDILGECTKCTSCSIYYKTEELLYETCPEGKWRTKEEITEEKLNGNNKNVR